MGGINLSANINFGQWLMELTDEGDVWAFFYAATTGDMPQLDQRTLYPMIVDRDNVQPDGLGGTVAVDTAVVDEYGLRTNGAYVQRVGFSQDTSEWTGSGPWTRTVTLTATGTHTLSTDLSGATVSIAAGTATIDGAASATYGTPDQFECTGTGTVTLTTDTADPKAQITATAYKMPYTLSPTADPVSVGANNSYDDSGTLKGPHFSPLATSYPQLYDVLDGKADGVELVTNGDMAAPGGWTDYVDAVIDINNAEQHHSGAYSCKCVTGSSNGGIQLLNLITTVTGWRYRAIVWVDPTVSTTVRVGIRNGDNSGWLYDAAHTVGSLNTWNKIEIDITETAGGAGAYLIVYQAANNTFYADDISVKQISRPATGIITDTIRFGFGYGVTDASEHILSLSSWFLFHRADGKLGIGDGANWAYADADYKAGTDYRYTICHGMHPTDTLSSEKVTNGDMELDSNWADFGTPTTNERSSTRSHTGAYSRHIVTDADAEGIKSDDFDIVAGREYEISGWFWAVSGVARLHRFSSAVIAFNLPTTTTGQWEYVSTIATGLTTATTKIKAVSTGGAAEFYVDDVSVKATNQPKMQLQVDELTDAGAVEESWVSAVTDFAGTWSPGDALSFGYDNPYPMNPARKLLSRGPVRDTDWKVAT